MSPRKIAEYPFSIKLPPELRLQLEREGAVRGGLAIGPLIRMILAEFFQAKRKRRKRQDKIEAQEPKP